MYPPPATDARVVRIERGAVHDGPGVRTVIFLKGCPLRCLWCHSPETQAARPQVLTYPERCLQCEACAATCPHGAAGPALGLAGIDRAGCAACGACTQVCPTSARVLAGAALPLGTAMAEILADRPFYDQSGGGVTLSGGEPLLQPAFSLALLARCRREGIHTAVETCGLVGTDTLLRAVPLTDLFLFDLKLMDEARHQSATGASNLRILAHLERLIRVQARVRVRIPFVPGVNDDAANIEAVGRYLSRLRIKTVDILPYHRGGVAKYGRLGLACPLPETIPPGAVAVTAAADTLRARGLTVNVGGM